MAATPVRSFNLVVPLAHEATVMRSTDTAGEVRAASGAVACLDNRAVDVDCTMGRRSPATRVTPGTRASTTATRTTTTRTTSFAPAPSADRSAPAGHADLPFIDLVQAYLDCRRTKRTTLAALDFEVDLEHNLVALHRDLAAGTYRPGRSICFAIRRPKLREVWAAQYSDRIVHHLLYNAIAARFERAFIADSCACIPGRGTHYGASRVAAKIRSVSHNWSRPAWYLKLDIARFFVAIDKRCLADQLLARIQEPGLRWLAMVVLFHDPRTNVDVRGDRRVLERIPRAKSLFAQDADHGLPIGNLSSQFFANVYLDALDQYVKHDLRARHYARYVDDMVLLHEDPAQLNAWRASIERFLPERLGVEINPSKTILQPVARGVDFVGHIIKPWRTIVRRRTFNEAVTRIAGIELEQVHQSANSYFGLLRQASHSHADRARLANVVRRRGLAVDHTLTKCYRPSAR